MFKRLFETCEAMIKAVTYLMVLVIGVAVATLAAFTVLFLSVRIGQFLWDILLRNRW